MSVKANVVARISHKLISLVLVPSALIVGVLVGGLTKVFASAGTSTLIDPRIAIWAFLSAAISTGLGSLAAGLAVAYVGSSAVSAIGEKPELAGRALIFVGLAEGIAIYGLIVSIMILGKV